MEKDAVKQPKYRVLELSLIGQALVQPGAEIDNYDGLPGGNLLPLNDAAKAKFAEVEALEPARVAAMEKTYGDKNPFSNAEAFAKAIADAIQLANADLRRDMEELRAQLAAKTPPAEPESLG